ncbi:MAG: glycosyltransferase family 2 protein [Bacteroidota bacterium]
MFGEKYLQKNNNIPLIHQLPENDLGIIVVIPCLREPDILKTLESVGRCDLPKVKVEVIVLINHSETASAETKAYNLKTKTEIEAWISNNPKQGIRFFTAGSIELKKKWAGAGLARKWGMDEAVRRFNLLGKANGLIVSLDADTLVDKNYLTSIENHFIRNPKHIGATVAFKHQTENLLPKQLEGILLYEKYLKYYKEALAYSGYPHAMFTVGSAFTVKAGAYVKRGGMNRRQAGEDFYFLQNLVQMGKVGEITSTTIYPSARLSDRVPFGTGPILQKWMDGQENLEETYNFEAFKDLKAFFDLKDTLFKIEKTPFDLIVSKLPQPIGSFIKEDNFWDDLEDLNRNCSTLKSFQTRFYQKFNAFKILKFLNFSHESFYEKVNIEEQVAELAKAKSGTIN